MRIVHIITRLVAGGAGEGLLLACREQAAAGHEVTLLAGPPWSEGSLLAAAQALPIRTVLVPALRRGIRPVGDLEAYADIAKHLRDIHPDVVHTHSFKAGVLGRLAARRAGVPCILSQAGIGCRSVISYSKGGASLTGAL
jgi:hypothetical protein